MINIEALKFPIGPCPIIKDPTTTELSSWIATIEGFPEALRQTTEGLSSEQKQWCYRPEGWTIQQVVHHCADSHMNSFIRCKLALTEDAPTIRPYYEDRWATLVDSNQEDLEDSMLLLKALHKKWGVLWRSLTASQWQLEYIHPEHGKRFTLAETVGIYAWHSNHHLAHIKNAIVSKGQYVTEQPS